MTHQVRKILQPMSVTACFNLLIKQPRNLIESCLSSVNISCHYFTAYGQFKIEGENNHIQKHLTVMDTELFHLCLLMYLLSVSYRSATK